MITYLTREEWGADPAYPRLGYKVAPPLRTYNIVHHTVGSDNDETRNLWETLDEVKANMRRLQTIRPDLGLDVPYNFVAYLLPLGKIAVCEGRGFDRTGAHTKGYNTSGIATSFAGDFENYATNVALWLPAINRWMGMLKLVFPFLGTTSKCGHETCGHKDFPNAATACPGTYLYSVLPQITFDMPVTEEDEMQIIGQFAKSIPWQMSYLVFANAQGKVLRQEVAGPAEYEALVAAGFPTKKLASVESITQAP